jgi:hypothetical protein
MKINVVGIEPAWRSCAYKLQVWVDKDTCYHNRQYVLETLRKWFGTAEYFWDDCYLCDLKAGRA